MPTWNELGLKKKLVDALMKLRITESFDVQKAIIPVVLKGKHVVCTAQTGSGKTLAYTLGYLGKINRKQGLQMIVIVPTRELCIQVGKEITKICDVLEIKVGMLYGGREIKGDYKTVTRNNQIIVGTPGRLLEHINMKRLTVGDVKYLVFDESDQMFDNGFYRDCVYLKKRVSRDVQILLASATITEKVEAFITQEIPHHEYVKIGESAIPSTIVQEKMYCEKIEKNEFLYNFFRNHHFKRIIVFCNTKIKAHNIAEWFENKHLNAKSFTGDLTQDERLQRLNVFKEGKIKILVTTDIAARGLHIDSVDAVINYDAPTRSEFYVHRIGRTGRVNKDGYALTLLCPEDVERFANIESEFAIQVQEISKDISY